MSISMLLNSRLEYLPYPPARNHYFRTGAVGDRSSPISLALFVNFRRQSVQGLPSRTHVQCVATTKFYFTICHRFRLIYSAYHDDCSCILLCRDVSWIGPWTPRASTGAVSSALYDLQRSHHAVVNLLISPPHVAPGTLSLSQLSKLCGCYSRNSKD